MTMMTIFTTMITLLSRSTTKKTITMNTIMIIISTMLLLMIMMMTMMTMTVTTTMRATVATLTLICLTVLSRPPPPATVCSAVSVGLLVPLSMVVVWCGALSTPTAVSGRPFDATAAAYATVHASPHYVLREDSGGWLRVTATDDDQRAQFCGGNVAGNNGAFASDTPTWVALRLMLAEVSTRAEMCWREAERIKERILERAFNDSIIDLMYRHYRHSWLPKPPDRRNFISSIMKLNVVTGYQTVYTSLQRYALGLEQATLDSTAFDVDHGITSLYVDVQMSLRKLLCDIDLGMITLDIPKDDVALRHLLSIQLRQVKSKHDALVRDYVTLRDYVQMAKFVSKLFGHLANSRESMPAKVLESTLFESPIELELDDLVDINGMYSYGVGSRLAEERLRQMLIAKQLRRLRQPLDYLDDFDDENAAGAIGNSASMTVGGGGGGSGQTGFDATGDAERRHWNAASVTSATSPAATKLATIDRGAISDSGQHSTDPSEDDSSENQALGSNTDKSSDKRSSNSGSSNSDSSSKDSGVHSQSDRLITSKGTVEAQREAGLKVAALATDRVAGEKQATDSVGGDGNDVIASRSGSNSRKRIASVSIGNGAIGSNGATANRRRKHGRVSNVRTTAAAAAGRNHGPGGHSAASKGTTSNSSGSSSGGGSAHEDASAGSSQQSHSQHSAAAAVSSDNLRRLERLRRATAAGALDASSKLADAASDAVSDGNSEDGASSQLVSHRHGRKRMPARGQLRKRTRRLGSHGGSGSSSSNVSDSNDDDDEKRQTGAAGSSSSTDATLMLGAEASTLQVDALAEKADADADTDVDTSPAFINRHRRNRRGRHHNHHHRPHHHHHHHHQHHHHQHQHQSPRPLQPQPHQQQQQRGKEEAR